MDGEERIIFDEPGRVLGRTEGHGGTDCRSHYFRVVKHPYDSYRLLVRHGGGDESWPLDYSTLTIDALRSLDSDARYRILWVIMQAHHDSERAAKESTAKKYVDAFISGRLKKRGAKVWIVPEPSAQSTGVNTVA